MTANRFRLLSTAVWLLVAAPLLYPNGRPLLVVFAFSALIATRLIGRRLYGYYFRRTFLDGLLLVYLLITALAYLLSPLPELSLPKFTGLLWGLFGYYLAQDWLDDVARIRQLGLLLGGGAVSLALLAPVVVAWPTDAPMQLLLQELPDMPALALAHRQELAILLVTLLPLTAGWFIWTSGSLRWIGIVAVVVVGGVLLLSGSRAALLVMALIPLVAWTWGRRPPVYLFAVLILLLGVTLLGAFWFAPLLEQDGNAVVQLDALSRPGSENSWLVRVELWQAAAQMLRDYPVLGAGLFAFFPSARSNYVFDFVGFDKDLVHAHNLFLHAGASAGWPGLLLEFLLWSTSLLTLWEVTRHGDAETRRTARLWGIGLWAYLLFMLVDVLTLANRPGVILWFLLAGVAALARLTHQEVRLSRVAPLLPLLLLLFLALFNLRPNLAALQLDRYVLAGRGSLPEEVNLAGDRRRLGTIAFYRGDEVGALAYWQSLEDGASFARERGFQAQRARDYDLALRFYTLAILMDPGDRRSYYWRGLAYKELGAYRAAESDLARAVALSESTGDLQWLALLEYQWGTVLAQQGEYGAARGHLERAVKLDTEKPHYFTQLGDVLIALGEETEAAAAYEQAGTSP